MLKKFAYITQLLLLAVLCGCSASQSTAPVIVPASASFNQETPPPPVTITLAAVGDNLLHNTVYHWAQTANGYDFLPLYQPVSPLIEQADIAFVNQEAPASGQPPSSYPTFNSPQEALRDLVKLGFDVINLANNHMMDKGGQAVLDTLAFTDTLECLTIGAHQSSQARTQPAIIEKNGITVGFLGYTYGTNGIPLPKNQPDLISLIDPNTIASEASALRSQCDFLVVSMHWGNEYQLSATAAQKELAQLLADLHVDIIIGTHPHVIQPAQWLEAADGGHRTFVIYSLGNFISSQSRTNTMLGGMLTAQLQKTADGVCSIEAVGLLPLVTHFESGMKNYCVYPLSQYPESLAQKHYLRKKNGDLSTDYFLTLSQDIWGEFWQDETSAALMLQ